MFSKFSLTLFIYVLFSMSIFANNAAYPIPPKNDKMLFYLQRSHNSNTVVYEANYSNTGDLTSDDPIKVYWMRFEEGGRIADLSFIQKRAFGVKCKQKDKSKPVYQLQFNNFNKRDILLQKNMEGKYKAYIRIGDQTAELESVYIQTDKNALGMSMNFKFMDLSGISITTRKKVFERVKL